MSEVLSNPSPMSPKSSPDAISKHSGKMTFPLSAKSMSSSKSVMQVLKSNSPTNPFKIPTDQDIFMLRDQERLLKREERQKQHGLALHKKTTYSSQMNAKTAAMRKGVLDTEEEDNLRFSRKKYPEWTLAVTKDRNVEKENLADYISKKREMFLVQYSLTVKRDEMQKLEYLASAEENKLERAEKFLEEDAAIFDEFLKENDRSSVEAIKLAESETKAKMDKVAEIKKNTATMMAIKSEISKHDETLKEYVLYKEFLSKLTPTEWGKENQAAETERKRAKLKEQPHVSHGPLEKKSARKKGESETQSRHSSKPGRESAIRHKPRTIRGSATSRATRSLSTPLSVTDSESVKSGFRSDDESEEEEELYFTDPKQLLQIFQELEEQNLSLITNSQETEEAMEELKHTIKLTKEKLDSETQILKSQISLLKGTIRREEEKAFDLGLKAKMFSYGEFKAEDQEKMLKELHKKVEEVFKGCIGENEANISTLQMLTAIENKLEELFESIEMMPPELVDSAEKAKEKERRMRLREEKLAAQRVHQEERVKKALERAKADPKKKTGRKLVTRSEPPQRKLKENKTKNSKDKEEEELLFFFT